MKLNDLKEGDSLNQDGWVYRDEKRVRKWFRPRHGWNHFWHPIGEQIVRLEATWYKLHLRQHKFYSRLTSLLEEVVRSVPVSSESMVNFKTFPTHIVHGKFAKDWYKFIVRDQTKAGGVLPFSRHCTAGPPENPVMPELGDKLAYMDNRQPYWHHKVFKVLEESLHGYIRSNFCKKESYEDGRLCLTINGRDWWFSVIKYSDTMDIKTIVTPENTTRHHTIEGPSPMVES